eukprot:COSAG01_NODE_2643_length_7322_cov_27.914994_8_plen_72_part_00
MPALVLVGVITEAVRWCPFHLCWCVGWCGGWAGAQCIAKAYELRYALRAENKGKVERFQRLVTAAQRGPPS